MSCLVGKKAPQFSAKAVINGNEIIDHFSLDQFQGNKYVVFFFYPKDFSGICPYELHYFQEKLNDFRSKDVEVVACSTDTEESHLAWLKISKDNGGIEGVTYPIVADNTKTISTNYGVLFGEYDIDENDQIFSTGPMIPFRGLFLIDKNGIVQHQMINFFTLVRNVDEVLRTIDALQYFEKNGEFCPVN